MKNIAVVGSNGFVGSSIATYLKSYYNVVGITRQTVDVLDNLKLRAYLTKHQFDCVIICAATMQNTISDISNNLGLLINFYNNRDLFGRLINTASAAEYDRQRDINLVDEEEIFTSTPNDYYGLGQNLRSRICVATDNFYNLRIFNCFGLNEIKTRIFPRFISSKLDFLVFDDRYFDYFSIQDLCKVVHYFIHDTPKVKDINCVYKDKYLISEVVNKFRKIHNIQKNIIIKNRVDKNYTGNYSKLYSINLPLIGLEQGLQNYFANVNTI